MWSYAIDSVTSSRVFLKECISRSGHIILVEVHQNPYRIKIYPNTFIDEIKLAYEGEEKKYFLEKRGSIDIKEAELLNNDGKINLEKIKFTLSPILIDPEIKAITELIEIITNHH